MSTPPAIHVTPFGPTAWAIRAAGEGRPLSEHDTREAAIRAGRAMATSMKTDLVIFDQMWRVELRERFDATRAASDDEASPAPSQETQAARLRNVRSKSSDAP